MKRGILEGLKIIIIFILLLCGCLLIKNSEKDKLTVLSNSFENTKVVADSAIVMECNSKRILYEKDCHQILPPASLTKVLTAITALENMNLNNYFLMRLDFINIEGSKIYLEDGDFILGYDLLYGLLLRSGNDCASAISHLYSGNEEDFLYKMNEMCRRLGMFDSTFINPSGLDQDGSNYTSAYDLAVLMSYALQNETFRKITSTKKYVTRLPSGKSIMMVNKHKLIQNNILATGGKTGYTKKAGRTLITSFKDEEMEIVVVTMNASDDWNTHEELARIAFSNYKMKKIMSKLDFKLSTMRFGDFKAKKSELLIPLKEDEVPTINLVNSNNLVKIDVLVDKCLICTLKFKGKNYE